MARQDGILKRLPDWYDRFKVYLRDTGPLPFETGENDCVLWSLGAVDAMTGSEIADRFRGKYSTADEAADFMESQGWESLTDAVSEIFGEPMPLVEARRGDLILMAPGPEVSIEGNGILAVFFGQVLFPGPTRLRSIPLIVTGTFDAVAFKVPH